MLQRFSAGLVVILALIFATSGVAQDVKKDVKKDAKPAVVNSQTKDAKAATATAAKKPTKPPTFKHVGCTQPGCGFWAKSHSRKELQAMIKKHSKRHHKVVLTDKQAKDLVKAEGTK